MNNSVAKNAYKTALNIGSRLPELEPIISMGAGESYHYARDIIKGRWLEAEPTISKKSNWACLYARDVLKGRWIEAEPVIAREIRWAYIYAEDVIKGRWPEAEQDIAQDAYYALMYSIHIIKRRFHKGEKMIWKSEKYLNEYINLWFDEPIVIRNEVDEFAWLRSGAEGYFSPASWFKQSFSFLDELIGEYN